MNLMRKDRNFGNGGALVPFGGFPSLNRIRDEFDRLFDRFLGGWPTMPEDRWNLDVQDTAESILVRAEAPGFDANDFDLHVAGNLLTIRAAHKAETKDKDGGRHEWSEREISQSFTLPTGVDPNKIEAQYKSGVLTITLPKTEEMKGRRIPVTS